MRKSIEKIADNQKIICIFVVERKQNTKQISASAMSTKLQQISELSTLICDKNTICGEIHSLFDRFRINKSLKKLNMEKQKGQSTNVLLKCLLIFRLCGNTIYQSYLQRFGGITDGGKNQFYRILERPNMDWRKLLIMMAKSFVRIVKTAGQTNGFKYAIIDDTTLEKTGKTIESITKVYDHTTHSFVLGFKKLLLAISDGKSTIPFDFSLHSETHSDNSGGLTPKQKRNRRIVKRSDNDCAKQRKSELKQKKNDMAIIMLKRMFKFGIHPLYVLVDKWFCNAAFIAEVRKIGKGAMHIISLVKDKRTKFSINGIIKSAQILCKEHDHNLHYCRQYRCRYFKIDAVLNGMNVRLFVVRYGNNGYEVMITTDKSLRFQQAFENYQQRWSIEVLFKECKQYLKLGSCQSTNLNSQIADCTIVLMGYMILSLFKRFSDYEVLGELFRDCQKQFLELSFIERLLPLLAHILSTILNLCNTSWNELLENLMANEQAQAELIPFLKIINTSKNE